MMNNKNIAIRICNIGKKYTIGGPQEQYLTLINTIVNSVKARFTRFCRSSTHWGFWALKEVSFDVRQSDVVFVRRGAGKATLLNILSRITAPTEGPRDLHGLVESLRKVRTCYS